jgi:hypothetical protein
MTTYSGKVVTWEQALKSEHRLGTDSEEWTSAAPVSPDADGNYAIATPGRVS